MKPEELREACKAAGVELSDDTLARVARQAAALSGALAKLRVSELQQAEPAFSFDPSEIDDE